MFVLQNFKFGDRIVPEPQDRRVDSMNLLNNSIGASGRGERWLTVANVLRFHRACGRRLAPKMCHKIMKTNHCLLACVFVYVIHVFLHLHFSPTKLCLYGSYSSCLMRRHQDVPPRIPLASPPPIPQRSKAKWVE